MKQLQQVLMLPSGKVATSVQFCSAWIKYDSRERESILEMEFIQFPDFFRTLFLDILFLIDHQLKKVEFSHLFRSMNSISQVFFK